jgi:hypothetical protein
VISRSGSAPSFVLAHVTGAEWHLDARWRGARYGLPRQSLIAARAVGMSTPHRQQSYRNGEKHMTHLLIADCQHHKSSGPYPNKKAPAKIRTQV